MAVALYMLANPLRFWSQADGAHWEPRGQATHLREVEGALRRDRVVLSSSAYLVNVDAKQQKRKLFSFMVYLYVCDASDTYYIGSFFLCDHGKQFQGLFRHESFGVWCGVTVVWSRDVVRWRQWQVELECQRSQQ